jgi:hypothetical protein
VTSGLTADKITIDLYITPRELSHNERISGDMAVLVQVFCEDFALSHLHRFSEQCEVESIKAPKLRGG